MSRTGRSLIHSVLTAKDLEVFVDAFRIPERFSPTLPGLDEPAECTPDRIVIYTLSFSSCGVRYPLSAFQVNLLRHFGVHFSQLHPLGFMRVVHFELSCVAVSGESSVPLFCMFYKLISDVEEPMMLESPPLRDSKASIEDSIPVLSADEIVQWKRMYENPTRAFTFPEGVLAMGGLSPFYSVRPKAFFGKKVISGGIAEIPVSRSPLGQGSSKAPIKIPLPPTSSWVRDRTPDTSAACVNPAFDISPLRATGTSKPSDLDIPVSHSPLAPLFAEALLVPYIPKWKITSSTVVGTPETAREFLAHVVPPSQKFMNSALRSDLFDDQYSMSLCEGFFRGAGMLQRMDELRRANEELRTELRTSQTIADELRCRVTDVERMLLEEKSAGAMLEQKERACERERTAWAQEREELVAELKHQKELDSVSQGDLNTMYAEWGIDVDDNQKLAKERYRLITEGFGSFLTIVSQSE
ncbi:hypothetical protein HanHA89_Chr10g0389171 [Helianthus annuus]|nr:hypothetical protein HanHA89_Chr10g0389171 [Helianthus annuus]